MPSTWHERIVRSSDGIFFINEEVHFVRHGPISTLMNTYVTTLRFLSTLLLLCSASSVTGADVWTDVRTYGNNIVGNKTLVNVVLEGEIRKGDHETLFNVLKDIPPPAHAEIILRSPGGDYNESIKIGRLLRKAKLGANIPYWRSGGASCSPDDGYPPPKDKNNCICASACAFIFFGAVHKNGTMLGLHRPYFAPSFYSTLQPDDASAQYQRLIKDSSEYLKEMGITEEIQKRILASASNDIDFLEPEYVKKYLWGWTPDIEEWMLAKCPRAAPARRGRELSQKFAAGTITTKENAELDAILSADRNEQSCLLEASLQLRKSGYKSAFGK